MDTLDVGFLFGAYPLWTLLTESKDDIEFRGPNGLRAFPLMATENVAEQFAAEFDRLKPEPIGSLQQLHDILTYQKETRRVPYASVYSRGQRQFVFIRDLLDIIESALRSSHADSTSDAMPDD